MARRLAIALATLTLVFALADTAAAQNQTFKPGCVGVTRADVVALDQAFYNNRLGAFQAGGMIFALKRDVRATDMSNQLRPGKVMLRRDKRPRPIVLRVNHGDCLEVTFTNLLAPVPVIYNHELFPQRNHAVPGDTRRVPYTPNNNDMKTAYNAQGTGEQTHWDTPNPSVSQVATRLAGVHVMGLELVGASEPDKSLADISADGSWVGANDVFASNSARRRSGLVEPGATITYVWRATAEGSFLLYSTAANAGDSGAFGGQLSQGLFGSVSVQPKGTEWYRSQVTRADLLAATYRATATNVTRGSGTVRLHGQDFQRFKFGDADVISMNEDGAPTGEGGYLHTPAGQPIINYAAMRDGVPILKMTDKDGNLVHSDLTAFITGPNAGMLPESAVGNERNRHLYPNPRQPFREFLIHYHDDFVTTQAFPEFNGSLQYTLGAGRDFFAINYGMGGIGAEILANRLGVGPMYNCTTCRFEEFFLSSWTNGDPAQVVDFPANTQVCGDPAEPEDCSLQMGPKATKAFYPDDPSNVYHSYMSDHVKFQIVHAGTNITHVHHLHAQQWLHSPKNENGHYRDSQLISPGASFTLDHVFNGSGNLNKTVGDSIFHCHFYPHFAQGMWSLWRVHDVFEQGTRMDGDRVATGWNRALPDGEIATGTPTPALVPMPQIAMAPMPARTRILPVTAVENGNPLTVGYATQVHPDDEGVNPGYPFFVPGVAGQRAPHPPMDFAWEEDDAGNPKRDAQGNIQLLDGGLPRSIALFDPKPYEQHTRWDFSKINNTITALQLPEEGTVVEKTAMAAHAKRDHASFTPEGKPTNFVLNGRPPVNGAPYADPAVDENGRSTCEDRTPGKVLDPGANQPCLIRYKAAVVEIDAVINKKGWHYPQTRLLTLWGDVGDTIKNTRPPQPFFFRANSRQVIEFWHTNLVPNYYELDDFQVRTPTDIIGQHIHLVKFDVTSSDGGGNGYNYEDGTFSPNEVREIITSINRRNGIFTSMQLSGNGFTVGGSQRLLKAKAIPYFGNGPTEGSHDWVGAQTTVQRWFADPVLSNAQVTRTKAEHAYRPDVGTVDRTLRTVFTHDHFGPSTHQQTGLYAGLLTEPTGSQWFDPETNTLLGSNANRPAGADKKQPMDGGPTTWQALIVDTADPAKSYREFALEFQDRQLAYNAQSRTTPSRYVPGNTADYTGWSDPKNAISPPINPNTANRGVAPWPFIVTGSFGSGTYSLNYRNEPLPFRVAPFSTTFFTNAPPAPDPGAADLSQVFRSIMRTDAQLNVQPAQGTPINPPSTTFTYPRPFTGAGPTDPYTPLLRAYAGDNVQVRVLVGAHMSPHTFTMHGVNWLFETENHRSGYRATQSMGISEHFEMLFNVPRSAAPDHADYFYSSSSDVNGLQAGNWGIMRAYNTPQQNLVPLPNNNPPSEGAIADCTGWSGTPQKTFNVTAVNVGSLSNAQKQKLRLFYNRRGRAGTNSAQLFDPNALVYLLDGKAPEDSNFEPMILRANAGDCITINLSNKFSSATPGSQGLAPAFYTEAFRVTGKANEVQDWVTFFNQLQSYMTDFMVKFNGNRWGFTLPAPETKQVTVTKTSPNSWTFTQSVPSARTYIVTQTNDTTLSVAGVIPMATSANAGLHAQLVAQDPYTSNGINVGDNPLQTAARGNTTPQKYVWYAGRINTDGKPEPVEFGSINLTPSDPLKQHPFGLLGALIIEPQGSTWRADVNSQASAVVTTADGKSFREFVAVVQDDVASMQMSGSVSSGPNIVLSATHAAEDPGKPKVTVPIWGTGTPYPDFNFPVPNNSKFLVRAGDTVGVIIQENAPHGFSFLNKTAGLAMFDIAAPSSPFKAQPGVGPNAYGTDPNQCPNQTVATLKAKANVPQRSTADFECTVHKKRMAGTFVYADPEYDLLIQGLQVGGTAPAQGTHVWALNGVAQPNNTEYPVKPGQRILVAVGSELHGLTFAIEGNTSQQTEIDVKKVFDFDTLLTQPTFDLSKYVPFIGVPAIPGGWGTAGYGAPVQLVYMTVRADAPSGTRIPFMCTIHQSGMAGTFVVNGTDPPDTGTGWTISGDNIPGSGNVWALSSPASPTPAPMPNNAVYRVQPGDTITFNVVNGTHGVTFMVDEATANQIFEFIDIPDNVKFQTQPGNIGPPPPPSWGTPGFKVTPPQAPQLLVTVRVRANVPRALQVVPFECTIHTSGMAGVIAIGDADATAVGVTPVPPQWTRAVNYRTEPLPYRYANANFLSNFDPCTSLSPLGIARALSNTQVLADPQTPVFVAEAGKPVRMRLLHPGGNDEQTFTLHGHNWQEEPFLPGSTVMGDNPTSQYLGSRDGFGPNVSWDMLLPSAGGVDGVKGDYLYRTFITTDFLFGLWGIMRVGEPGKDVVTVTRFPKPGEANVPANGAMIAGVTSVNPSTGTMADFVSIESGSIKERVKVDPRTGAWSFANAKLAPPVTVTSLKCNDANCSSPATWGSVLATGYIPVIVQNLSPARAAEPNLGPLPLFKSLGLQQLGSPQPVAPAPTPAAPGDTSHHDGGHH